MGIDFYKEINLVSIKIIYVIFNGLFGMSFVGGFWLKYGTTMLCLKNIFYLLKPTGVDSFKTQE